MDAGTKYLKQLIQTFSDMTVEEYEKLYKETMVQTDSFPKILTEGVPLIDEYLKEKEHKALGIVYMYMYQDIKKERINMSETTLKINEILSSIKENTGRKKTKPSIFQKPVALVKKSMTSLPNDFYKTMKDVYNENTEYLFNTSRI
ncbi:hypothetical protein FUT79_05350 [Treponema phagedenis]|uniref:hypothetical protein n=1 Tax=Treponema phagedenis TaxID=162 RepID=UPI0011E6DD67|nr:hypothetical protein [Treponema phagedenis]QEJ94687.1 hypothetical protein FUT79_05350 [Treponema phagedenis]